MTVSSLHTVFFSADPFDYRSPVTGSVMNAERGTGVVGWGPLSIHAYDMGLLADRLAAMADKARQVADEIAAGTGGPVVTRRLIVVTTHDDVYEDGECIESGWTEEVDAGPATPEQIAASDAEQPCGFIRVNDRGDVVEPGSWDDQRPGVRTCYVEVES